MSCHPILYVLAKQAIAFLIDYYYSSIRKTIFISIVFILILCYAGFLLGSDSELQTPNTSTGTSKGTSMAVFEVDGSGKLVGKKQGKS